MDRSILPIILQNPARTPACFTAPPAAVLIFQKTNPTQSKVTTINAKK
jgi:hypothetical protein